MKKNNFLLLILSPFKYFFLGCYYTMYGILYPLLFLYNNISSLIFRIYNNNERNKSKKEVLEIANLKTTNNSNKNINNGIKIKNDENINKHLYKKKDLINNTKKEHLSKKLQGRDYLITEINKNESTRLEKPVTFKYEAVKDGKITKGFIDAFSKQEVFEFLESQDYKVYKLETNKYIELFYGRKQFIKKKLKTKDLIFWLTQLSTYLKSGIPLTDAMKILSMQMGKRDNVKKRIFESVVFQLIMGESFSSALEKQGSAFPPLLINMIKAAEATGELENTLDDMTSYYNEIETTRKQMISALTYPTVVMIFSLAVITFMLVYIVPQFSGIYESAGVQLNGFTLFILSASNFLKKNVIYILLGIILVILIIILIYKKIKAARYYMQYFAMHLPVFGKIIIYNELTIFTKTFSSLLRNNVFITESMEILSKITNNEIYKQIMFNTINNIAVGEKISTSFKDNWAIPDVAYYMIVTGESTGELAEMMGKVSIYYQEEHKNIINTLKSLIEPAMIIILAVIVGGVIIAIIIPMFSLYSQIS